MRQVLWFLYYHISFYLDDYEKNDFFQKKIVFIWSMMSVKWEVKQSSEKLTNSEG